MRILSLNCWAGRLHTQLHHLADFGADVMCFSEVTRLGQSRSYTWEDGETYQTNVFGQLKRMFAERALCFGYQSQFLPACTRAFNVGGVDTPTEYGLATFIREDMSVLEQRSRFVNKAFAQIAGSATPEPRNAHVVRMWVPSINSFVVVAHMHGLWDERGKHDTPQRSNQASRFAMMINSIKQEGDKVVACGDWNVLPDSETISLLRTQCGLADLIQRYNITDTRTSHYNKPGKPRHADYMMVSANCAVRDFQVPAQPEMSDHRVLVLDIE
jgi:hypothetical protein